MNIRKKGSEPRDTVLTIRLSRSEQQRLKQIASEFGISVAKFLLGIAFGDIHCVCLQKDELS